jgi:hypothetical protein
MYEPAVTFHSYDFGGTLSVAPTAPFTEIWW